MASQLRRTLQLQYISHPEPVKESIGKYILAVPLLALLLVTGTFIKAQPAPQKQILSVMATQTNAWNNGDIEAFMQTYWNSDSLMFVGKNGATYGWDNTFNNYKKSYPDKTAMGFLTFNILKIQKLSSKFYNVVGKWHLKRSIGDVGGHFTLLFKKIKGQWLIVQDHSS